MVLDACQPRETTAFWLEKGSFEWDSFNHRLAYLSWIADEDAAQVALIGGASSTGVAQVLPDGCDSATCTEYPWYDSATVDLRWARVTTNSMAFGLSQATVLATSEGETVTLSIPMDGTTGHNQAAVIQGLIIDTNWPLSGGDSCYSPISGWLIRHMEISLLDPVISGDNMELQLHATFQAGNSLEEARICMDEVADQAQVPITVYVLAISSEQEIQEHDLIYEDSWELGEEQPEPDLSTRTIALGGPNILAGWSQLDFVFHAEDPDLRGAYLRSLEIDLDPSHGWASAWSSNYSPLTQLSGFSYSFHGSIQVLDPSSVVERLTILETVDSNLDEDGLPILHEIPWQ